MRVILLPIDGPLTTNVRTLSSSGSEWGMDVALDGLGNFYVMAKDGIDLYVAKYDSSSVLQWQRKLLIAGTAGGITATPAGDVYLASYYHDGVSNQAVLIKYNTSGAIQWQRKLGLAGNDFYHGVGVDGSGNVYAAGKMPTTNDAVLMAKYDSLGAIQWQNTMNGVDGDEANDIAVDSATGDFYIAGSTSSHDGVGGQHAALIAKFNSAGVRQWYRTLESGNGDNGESIALDNSGNVYVCGSTDISPGSNMFLVKYNSSGAIQWQRKLSSANNDIGMGVAVDTSGNPYITGYSLYAGGSNNNVIVAKYNSGGVLQWKNALSGAGNSDYGAGIANDGNNFYVVGRTDSIGDLNLNILVMQFSNNGGGAGTYGAMTYGPATSLTDSAGSMTDAAGVNLTVSAAGLTEAIGTMVDGPATLVDQAHT